MAWRTWASIGGVAALVLLKACGGSAESAAVEPTPQDIALEVLARVGASGGCANDGTSSCAEIPAFDPVTKRLFVVNGSNQRVDVFDASNPSALQTTTAPIASISLPDFSPNSVAVNGSGVLAIGLEAYVAGDPGAKVRPGLVAVYRTDNLGTPAATVSVGAQPDMVTFTPDGRYVLSANEGEPSGYNTGTLRGYADPEGSVNIIDVGNPSAPVNRQVGFTAFNGQRDALRAQGVRIFGPGGPLTQGGATVDASGATVAQDLEPEYITVSEDGSTAYVALQENNAIAVIEGVNTAAPTVTRIIALGLKDFSQAGAGLDLSDEDGTPNSNTGVPAISIQRRAVLGMYQPDAIATWRVNGVQYIVSANEGDARDWPGFFEETRVRSARTQDPPAPVVGATTAAALTNPAQCGGGGGVPDTALLGAANALLTTPLTGAQFVLDSNHGRLIVTANYNGGAGNTGLNAAGQCSALYAFGGRSISIWTVPTAAGAAMTRVWDSGDQIERITAQFSSSTVSNSSSPTDATVVNGSTSVPGVNVNYNYQFNGSHSGTGNNALDNRSPSKGPEPEGVVLGRIGEKTYAFVGLERVGGVMVWDVTNPLSPAYVNYFNTRTAQTGDRGPEGLAFVPASRSPTGNPLLIVSNEISGTTTLFTVRQRI
jgi:hypothetical protein